MDDKRLALLVRRAMQGDVSAFEEVYFAHAQAVLFHVRNQIFDKDNYQDVAQDVALTMWKHIEDLRKPKAFRSWMHQIIRTTCISHNRTLQKERERHSAGNDEEIIDALPAQAKGEEGDPALVLMQKDDEHRLFAAIEALPPAYRDAITLRYYDDLSYKEIAEVLNISTSAVGTNIKRGTEHLKMTLAQEGVTSNNEELKAATNQDTRTTAQAAPSALSKPGEQAEQQESKAERIRRKGEEMKESKPNIAASKDIQTGAAVAGAFAVSDESIKNSLATGVNEIIPPDAVALYTKEAHLSLIGAKAAGVSAASAAGAAAKMSGNIIITVVSSVLVVFAVTVGSYAVSTTGVLDEAPWQSSGAAAQKTVQYAGDPHIMFVNAEGSNSPYAVVAIHLEDWSITPTSIFWTVTDSEGGLVLSGEGAEINDGIGLSGLAPGEYKVNFELTDEQGATALSTRSFTIE